MSDATPQAHLDGFLAKYTPEIAAEACAAIDRLRPLVPGAVEMVYDNYNALVVGFGATEKASEAVLSIAVMPKWVDLCFLTGTKIPDPHGLLQGNGTVARHIVLSSADDIDRPEIRDLISAAIASSPRSFDTGAPNRLVIKSISAKQRPRRPPEKAAKAK
jgi:hypothetical protein